MRCITLALGYCKCTAQPLSLARFARQQRVTIRLGPRLCLACLHERQPRLSLCPPQLVTCMRELLSQRRYLSISISICRGNPACFTAFGCSSHVGICRRVVERIVPSS